MISVEKEEATSGSEDTPTESEEEEEQQEGRLAEPLELRHLTNRMGVDTSRGISGQRRGRAATRRMSTVEEPDWEWDSGTGGVTARRSVTRAPKNSCQDPEQNRPDLSYAMRIFCPDRRFNFK